jgi:hypothetical protein
MANKFGIPEEIEADLRRRFKRCAYCHRRMKRYAHTRGCPKDKATIEHLDRNPPFYWEEGLKAADLVICCGSCNASRGQKTLTEWFKSKYCIERKINAGTVAGAVKRYLRRHTHRH